MKKENEKKDNKNSDKGGQNQITLIFIVNGESIEIKANINAPLKTAVEKALSESENTGRPLEDWQVKWNGKILDLNSKIEELQLTDKTELFLSLKTGEGGGNA